MKKVTGKVLGTAAIAGAVIVGAALIAGKDDIRRFYRMRRM